MRGNYNFYYKFLLEINLPSNCRLADEMGLRECYTSTMVVEQEQQDEDSLNDLIDLTEECDIKPFIKQDGFQYDDMDTSDGSFLHETFSPLVNTDAGSHLTNGIEVVPATENDESIHSLWNKEFCTLAQFKGGEFINPVDLCTEHENLLMIQPQLNLLVSEHGTNRKIHPKNYKPKYCNY